MHTPACAQQYFRTSQYSYNIDKFARHFPAQGLLGLFLHARPDYSN